MLLVNFESFNRDEVARAKKKTKSAKRSMFNVKNNRQMNHLRQRVMERNFEGAFDTLGSDNSFGQSAEGFRQVHPKPRKTTQEERRSINGRVGALYAENIRQSLEDIEKGIGEVVKKISVYSKRKKKAATKNFEVQSKRSPRKTRDVRVDAFGMQEEALGVKTETSNRTSLADEVPVNPKPRKSAKKKRKSVSRSKKKKKPRPSGSSSFKHSKKGSNVFSTDRGDGKSFSLFASSLKNSMYRNEEMTVHPEDITAGLASLKDSGVFKKKSRLQRQAPERLISQSASRTLSTQQSPMRKKKKKSARDHSLKKTTEADMLRSSVQLKQPRRSSKRSVSKSLKKSKKQSLLPEKKPRANPKREKSTEGFKRSAKLPGASAKFKKVRAKPKRLKLKKQLTLKDNVQSIFKKNEKALKLAGYSQGRPQIAMTQGANVINEEPMHLSSFETSERSIKTEEPRRVSAHKRRSSQFELPAEPRAVEMFKKRKSLLEPQTKFTSKVQPKKAPVHHKKAQSQIDLRKVKNAMKKSKRPNASKSPNKKKGVNLSSKLFKTEVVNKFDSSSKLGKHSLHKLLYKKLKTSNLTPKVKKLLNQSEKFDASSVYVHENNTFSAGTRLKKFYTQKADLKRKKPKTSFKISEGKTGYKNLYQMKKEGHARLRKATQKQFAKYFGQQRD